MTVEQRIQAIATDKSRYTLDGVSGCWNWNGAKLRSGHGIVKVCRKPVMAYRVFFIFFVGTIAFGLQLHHRCENPSCVNPAHLVALTRGDHARLHAKLNHEKAAEIRRVYNRSGLTQREIAERFGVSQTTISCVLTGRTWAVPSAD